MRFGDREFRLLGDFDLERRLGDLERRLGDLERRFGDLERRLGDFERRFGDLERRLGDLERLEWGERRRDDEGDFDRLLLSSLGGVDGKLVDINFNRTKDQFTFLLVADCLG